jgi:hypothetical protein
MHAALDALATTDLSSVSVERTVVDSAYCATLDLGSNEVDLHNTAELLVANIARIQSSCRAEALRGINPAPPSTSGG